MSIQPYLILASASPRRQELIQYLGMPFKVNPSRYVEPELSVERVHIPTLVIQLAERKALEVASRIADGLVIGADTLVTHDYEWGAPIGKPTSRLDAFEMLKRLSGSVHRVYTGVSIIPVIAGEIYKSVSNFACTRVRFRDMTDSMINSYIDTGEYIDKAGAYGAQGYAAPYIESIEGDFFNVVGLPLCTLSKLIDTVKHELME